MHPLDSRAASEIVRGTIYYLHQQIAVLRTQAGGMRDELTLEEVLAKIEMTLLDVEGDFGRQTTMGTIDDATLEGFLEQTAHLLATLAQV